MHSFSNFETIQALPDIVTILELSQAIGLSHARTYQLLDERKIPYIRIQKKDHYIQGAFAGRVVPTAALHRCIQT